MKVMFSKFCSLILGFCTKLFALVKMNKGASHTITINIKGVNITVRTNKMNNVVYVTQQDINRMVNDEDDVYDKNIYIPRLDLVVNNEEDLNAITLENKEQVILFKRSGRAIPCRFEEVRRNDSTLSTNKPEKEETLDEN